MLPAQKTHDVVFQTHVLLVSTGSLVMIGGQIMVKKGTVSDDIVVSRSDGRQHNSGLHTVYVQHCSKHSCGGKAACGLITLYSYDPHINLQNRPMHPWQNLGMEHEMDLPGG